MHKRKAPPLKEDISPNLIPMIDIMFLLLLFFMLGADMGRREVAELILPLAGTVKEQKDRDPDETIVNVQHDGKATCAIHDNGGVCREASHWLWTVGPNNYTKDTLRPLLQLVADKNLEPDVDPEAGKRLSAAKIKIRADRTAPYGDVQKVIEICGTTGIYKIGVSAAQPPQG
ncbi:MAG: ExbD/TolR family protein [Planctomycetota bacterium]